MQNLQSEQIWIQKVFWPVQHFIAADCDLLCPIDHIKALVNFTVKFNK